MSNATYERIDLSGIQDDKAELAQRIFRAIRLNPQDGSIMTALSNFCERKKSPVLFHFDEAGGLTIKLIRYLREECLWIFKDLNTSRVHGESSPLFEYFPFFFFSGRGLAFEDLGQNVEISEMGSKWVILRPLSTTHISTIAEGFRFFQHFSESEMETILKIVLDWTGGSPRPIICLFFIFDDLVSAGFEDRFRSSDSMYLCMNDIWHKAVRNSALLKVFGCGYPREPPTENIFSGYSIFVFNALFQRSYQLSEFILQNLKVETALRGFNVFRVDVGSDKFQVLIPKFVSLHLLSDVSGGEYLYSTIDRCTDRSKLLEYSMSYIMILRQLTSPESSAKCLVTELVGDVELKEIDGFSGRSCPRMEILDFEFPCATTRGALCSKEDIKNVFISRQSTQQLNTSSLGILIDTMDVGCSLFFAPRSNTADNIIKLAKDLIIETQEKAGNADHWIKTTTLMDELNKSAVRNGFLGISVFFLIGTAGDRLRDVYLAPKSWVKISEGNFQVAQHEEAGSFQIHERMHVLIPSTNHVREFFWEISCTTKF
eukprot:TRINITY_DN2897_c0_g1_i1.p1 TRINITY_DN2897_c0_g1~~TRINITY_DN2897_c0_g1_i1.p1  ORF type:complete len:602 (-),score=141.24 TRINITY_DN2897_c0_g1_i1:105-1733(-)